MQAPPRRIGRNDGPQESLSIGQHPRPAQLADAPTWIALALGTDQVLGRPTLAPVALEPLR